MQHHEGEGGEYALLQALRVPRRDEAHPAYRRGQADKKVRRLSGMKTAVPFSTSTPAATTSSER